MKFYSRESNRTSALHARTVHEVDHDHVHCAAQQHLRQIENVIRSIGLGEVEGSDLQV